MANITFNKDGDKYVATFTAVADFNIHIEQKGGIVDMLQSSVEDSEYDYVKALNISKFDEVIDVDCTALIYPKYIKLVSKVKPTKAVVTYNQQA